MKLITALLVPLVLFGCASSGSKEAATDQPKPGAVVSMLAVVQATVVSIDYDNRFVTLREDNGELVTLHVDESARNFENVRVGDTVEADFYESVAIFVQTSDGQLPAVSEDSQVGIAPAGAKPGIAVADTIVVTADVVDIDYTNRTVTLRGPDNINRRFPVDDDAEGFENVTKGDQVVVRYTVAIAINVRTI